MSKNVRTQLNKVVGKSLNAYHQRVKPAIDDLKFKEEYQGRIIDCMVGEVDDNYIETPETDTPMVKLEHSREGVVKIPNIKGKTILVDADGNETDTPGEGCKLVSVGEDENNKLIILSKNKNIVNRKVIDMGHSQGTYVTSDNGGHAMSSSIEYLPKGRYSFSIDDYDVSKFVDASICIWKEDLSTHTWRRVLINKPFEILDGEVGFTWYGAVNKGAGETITPLVGKSIQVEKNEVRTSFVEPKQHKAEILLDQPLRRLNNEIYDEIVDNKIIRRVGRVVFSGEEAWWYPTNFGLESGEDYIAFCGDKLYAKSPSNAGYRCNVLNYKRYDGGFRTTLNFEGISDGGGYRMTFIRIKKEKLKTNDIQGFKDYLSDNPMEVLYALNEPIIEGLPNSITLQGFDDTTMYIENSITPTVSYGYNALIPYKEELSQQKEEVELNALDIENNIIPYLMDMEFNLMTMEDK